MLTFYTNGNKLHYKDDTTVTYQVATSTDLAAYLLKSGGTMTGSIAMGAHDITNIGTLSGSSISRNANDIVANTGTGTSGRVATFVSDKVIQDGGTLLSDLATTAAVAATYLPLAGGTMTGAINMGAQEISNLAAIRTSARAVVFGNGARPLPGQGGSDPPRVRGVRGKGGGIDRRDRR